MSDLPPAFPSCTPAQPRAPHTTHAAGLVLLPPCYAQMAKRLLGPRWDQSLRSRQLDLRGKKVTTLDDWRMRTALECEQATV